ncbi:cysteine desulfurase family protein [Bacillus methanolicus]|uniref:cysteine desulfurase n=1 Tax=Bacillus methanolicus (strain MGA3 / ATCC 53907) TaxID=796606 RepID=I3EAU3_BACMM|nr:cysteine desulfurase family protein [Bacillus methanolicus]AIE60850.1 Putative cysteine desulfurase IscS 1 [Bacillus methanolicus MGA3]EIJ83614.1 aminotransferase, class V [Bacillus methanolicus MGA3]UQD52854.1 cysteine desulfurase [Bacillus methanolicus]
MERIYLDHAATSPMHPKVVEAVVNVMNSNFGNPSSIHSFGREARQKVDEARDVLAKSIDAKPNEIIFTSGGTEADNLALIGIAEAYKSKGKHIISTEIEHHAVLNTCKELENRGYEVTYLPVDETGKISVEDLKKELRDDTILVSVMYGNNEVGTLQPIKEIGEVLAEHQAIFHTDAVQAYGLEKINVNDAGIDLLSVSAHKINGPKGIGFLYIRDGIKLLPRVFGGEQERKRRAGTENVASIVGFKEAAIICQQEMDVRREKYREWKNVLIKKLQEEEVIFSINGSLENSMPHVINLSFPGTNVEAMLVNLDLAGIAVSSGSACTAGSVDPSHVLVAMFGKDSEKIRNSIRFSFGLNNTTEQIEKAAFETAKIVKRLTKK